MHTNKGPAFCTRIIGKPNGTICGGTLLKRMASEINTGHCFPGAPWYRPKLEDVPVALLGEHRAEVQSSTANVVCLRRRVVTETLALLKYTVQLRTTSPNHILLLKTKKKSWSDRLHWLRGAWPFLHATTMSVEPDLCLRLSATNHVNKRSLMTLRQVHSYQAGKN